MQMRPELIVMLTNKDHTVPDAPEVFARCRDTKAKFWGFKEDGLPLPRMQALSAAMREAGKTTFLEVVTYTPEESRRGARMAAACGVDYLMGTMYDPEVMALCRDEGIQYLPFVGRVRGRPSILEGSLEEMLDQASAALEAGAWGIDLLGYRWVGDAAWHNREFTARVPAPVVLAGSINSRIRLDEVKAAGPWAFTIGSAFFRGDFGPDIPAQIDLVWDYMQT